MKDEQRSFYLRLLKLTLPLSLQSLMLAAVAAADAIMLGRLNQNAMSAVSLATQIQFVMNMFLGAVTGAGSILGAQYWGKGDRKTIDQIFNMMLRMILVIDAIFATACLTFSEPLMRLFTNDAELVSIGITYLRVAGWSYYLVGFSQCYQAMMKLSDHASAAALISFAAVMINIVMNALLIFGIGGFPSYGAVGAAMATLLSRVVELIWSVGCSLKKDYIAPNLRNFFSHNAVLLQDFLRLSLPVLGAYLLWGIGFTSFTAIMGHLGQTAAAAQSVMAVVRDLLCSLCNGIAAAGAIILGNELGQGKMEIAKLYGTRLMKLSIPVGIITGLLVILVMPLTLKFYKLSTDAQNLLVKMFYITSVYIAARAINTIVINAIFDGGGDARFDVISLIATMWGIGLPLALLGGFVFHWPNEIVYACTCIDEVIKIPWSFSHFYTYKWLNNLTREGAEHQ